jgi:hypothetical protein
MRQAIVSACLGPARVRDRKGGASGDITVGAAFRYVTKAATWGG